MLVQEGLDRHHEARLAKLREASTEIGAAPVEELSKHLFSARVLGPMADSETYAHLEHLRLAGEAERRERADGVLLYEVDALPAAPEDDSSATSGS